MVHKKKHLVYVKCSVNTKYSNKMKVGQTYNKHHKGKYQNESIGKDLNTWKGDIFSSYIFKLGY